MRFKIFGSLFVAVLFVYCATASADFEITARGAAGIPTSNFGFISSPSWMLSGDVTYGFTSLFQYGVTYDRNFLSYNNNGGNGTENFWGGIVRLGFFSGVFVDGQAGFCSRDSISSSFSYGAGLGYRMPISPLMDFSPRFGYRSLPDSSATRSMVDFGVMLTLKL